MRLGRGTPQCLVAGWRVAAFLGRCVGAMKAATIILLIRFNAHTALILAEAGTCCPSCSMSCLMFLSIVMECHQFLLVGVVLGSRP